MVIWLIGLSGAGKTSIGREVFGRLREFNPATVFLDGDEFRAIMGEDLGHTMEDRERNGWRMCRMSAWLDKQGIDVVACVLSNFPEQQAWNRSNLGDYFEVFIDVSMANLEARDQKGLYARARRGEISNVVGVDLPFHRPPNPDLVLSNEGALDQVRELADQVVNVLTVKAQ